MSDAKSIVLITDIDNTIYNFVDFHAPAFRAMVRAIRKALRDIDGTTNYNEADIVDQFRVVFREVGTLDFHNLIRNLSLSRALSDKSRKRLVRSGSQAFNSIKQRNLTPYPSLLETLRLAQDSGVIIIGATNAPFYHAYTRLHSVNCLEFFSGLIAWEGVRVGRHNPLFDPIVRKKQLRVLQSCRRRFRFFETFEARLSKPNSHAFCRVQACFGDARYIALGDSVSKDLAPAATLGMQTIWAKYGTIVDLRNLETILSITPWTETEVRTHSTSAYSPDVTVDNPRELEGVLLHSLSQMRRKSERQPISQLELFK